MADFPCHAKPKEKWCDKNGPGGFMGHTCRKMPDLAYLPLVMEEAAEVIQAIAKIQRFGCDYKYPEGDHKGESNLATLAFEIGDLLEVINFLGLPPSLVEFGREMKRNKLKKWGPHAWKP